MMNEQIVSVCPYCPLYRNCNYAPCTVLATVSVDGRKEMAYNCLQDVRRERYFESLRNAIDSHGVSFPSVPDGFECPADSGLLDDPPF